MRRNELDIRQQKLRDLLAEGRSVRDAGVEAGYSPSYSNSGLNEAIAKNPVFQTALTEKMSEIRDSNEVTVERLRKELWRIYHQSVAANDRSNAARSLELLGKTVCAFSDRVITKDDTEETALLQGTERKEAQKLVRIRMLQVERGL
ncbi:hypothetical protein ACFL6U_09195 [Planctomycetota bacterium]